MELGHFQILIGAILVVAAAVAAIVVDALRKHNERLRELTVELQLQRHHEDYEEPASQSAPRAKTPKAPAKPTAPKIAKEEPTLLDDELNETEEPELLHTDSLSAEIDAELGQKRAISAGAMAAIQKGLKRAAERGKNPDSGTATEESGPATKEAIQKLRRQRAAVIAAEYGAPEETASHAAPNASEEEDPIDPLADLEVPAPKGVSPSHAAAVPVDPQRDWGALLASVAEPTPKPAMADLVDVPREAFVAAAPEAAKPAARTTPVVTFEPTFGFLTDANAPPRAVILEPTPVVAAHATPSEELESVAAEPLVRQAKPETSTLPAGFQDGYVLSQLVLKKQPVSGLVVSIGAMLPNTEGQAEANGEPIRDRLRALIQSMLGARDFGAQSAEDEYLLIYPGERGASAQKRLSAIAERLWDFQLHSMGAFTIQFSWGGVEVRSESLDEAIASATERMEETRRSRRIAADVAALRRAS